MKSADEVIAQAEDLLRRCSVQSLERHAHEVWQRIEREQREAAEVMAAIPCQEYGREDIDPDTWRA